MDVFLSSSGERSRKVAEALRDWLPTVLKDLHPWTSSQISKGLRWDHQFTVHANSSAAAIICLSSTNVQSAWIAFEAGSLARAIGNGRLFVYLIGLEPAQLRGPLARFQTTRATEADTLKLIEALNERLGHEKTSVSVLRDRFKRRWPDLEAKLGELFSDVPGTERALGHLTIRGTPIQRTCFVAISDGRDNELFLQAIVPALERTSLVPVKTDGRRPQVSSARALIEASDLVIGDVSSRDNRVLYELGVAHALGKPMILLAQEGADVPFDMAHFRILEYRPFDIVGMRKLRRTLADAIRLTVTDVDRLKSDRSNVTEDYEPDDLVGRADRAQKEGRLSEAAALLENAARTLEDRSEYSSAAAAYNNLASLYQSLGLYSRALTSIQSSIDLQQRTNNTHGEAVSTGNLASIFDALGDVEQAQASYQRAIQLAQNLDNQSLLGSLFNNLAPSGNLWVNPHQRRC